VRYIFGGVNDRFQVFKVVQFPVRDVVRVAFSQFVRFEFVQVSKFRRHEVRVVDKVLYKLSFFLRVKVVTIAVHCFPSFNSASSSAFSVFMPTS
jgi:hypothetical protein